MNTPNPKKKFDPARVGRAGFIAFLSIARIWHLKVEQQKTLLGELSNSTYHKWKHQVASSEDFVLPKDILERISYIMGIYKALHILLPSEAADTWIHAKNSAPLFNGKSALDKMLRGNVIDLADVRRYLDAQRGM
jgi:hypothetical protein